MGNPEIYSFKVPPPGTATDRPVRVLAEKMKLNRQSVVDSIDDDEIFQLRGETGQSMWTAIVKDSQEMWLNDVKIWVAKAGQDLAEELFAGGDALDIALGAAIIPLSMASSSQYAISITNELRPNEGDANLKYIGYHLVDHWWVDRKRTPNEQDLRSYDQAQLAYSFKFWFLVSGGITGYYDCWMVYQLPNNGQYFGVRIHIPMQVGPSGAVGTAPSYQTLWGFATEFAEAGAVRIPESSWEFHSVPTLDYTFPKSIGAYMKITPNAGPDSLSFDVQVQNVENHPDH